jgi:dihydroorotase-like cyclic amidohydrolase
LGVPACVHAESYPLVKLFAARMAQEGRRAPIDHQRGRPVVAEVEAIWRTMVLAQAAGAHLHLLHVSSGSGAAAIKSWRQQGGQNVTAETCPPYLSLTETRLKEIGPYAKINPPLRTVQEQALLWNHVADGTIDTIGSDHAPHDYESKEKGWQDITTASAGAHGTETSLPVMLTHVNAGRLTLLRLIELMSSNVARLYGLYPRKGTIAVGADGDFTVVDLERRVTIDPQRLQVKDHRVARMFEGFETVGGPVLTVVRGRIVMRDGEIIGQEGGGRFGSRGR